MKTITTTVYEFDELNDKAKEKARDWWREHVLDYDWWEYLCEDAKTIGLEITEFDCYSREIKGKLFKSIGECASLILANHGKTCDTYILAKGYYGNRKLGKPYPDFEYDLLQCYLSLLIKEMDYLLSDEQVDESIEANGYTFTKDGKREG